MICVMASKAYISSADDLLKLKDAFMSVDKTGSGSIAAGDVDIALHKAGRFGLGADILPEREGEASSNVDFETFLRLAAASIAPPKPIEEGPLSPSGRSGAGRATIDGGSILSGARGVQATVTLPALGTPGSSADEGPDPKVEEFMKVLDDYRMSCEGEGNYEEAARAADQLEGVRKQEETRRIRAMRHRHESEGGTLQGAHDRQVGEFEAAWERYLAEFDAMASMYVAQMQERHGTRLLEFQQALHEELLKKPVKFSRELLEWRSREQVLAKQRKYADAAKVKILADELERRERRKIEEDRLAFVLGKENKFREKQGHELSALVKRIEARRSEHVKQRDTDSKRLLQRNRNVMSVLDQKHVLEMQRHVAELKAALHPLKALSPKHPSTAAFAAMRLEEESTRGSTASGRLGGKPATGTSPRTAALLSAKLGLSGSTSTRTPGSPSGRGGGGGAPSPSTASAKASMRGLAGTTSRSVTGGGGPPTSPMVTSARR